MQKPGEDEFSLKIFHPEHSSFQRERGKKMVLVPPAVLQVSPGWALWALGAAFWELFALWKGPDCLALAGSP